MNFTPIMQSYFRGEKLEALFFIIPAGVALGVVALRAERGAFAWGIAVRKWRGSLKFCNSR